MQNSRKLLILLQPQFVHDILQIISKFSSGIYHSLFRRVFLRTQVYTKIDNANYFFKA